LKPTDCLLLSECRDAALKFTQLVSSAAIKADVNPRTLSVRTLLHLPRVADEDGWVALSEIERELDESAQILREDAETVKDLAPDGKYALDELTFVVDFDPAASDRLFSALHYLRNAPRRGSRYFALADPEKGHPVTICSVSPFKWRFVGSHIRENFGIPQTMILNVSRVYSCDVAPYNAISSLLSKVRRSFSDQIDLLMTAVDPNLGFRGASYRAAGWRLWLTAKPRPYLYHNGRHVSPRQLKQRFGISDVTELQTRYPGDLFTESQAPLLAPQIFCCRTNWATEAVQLSGECPPHRLLGRWVEGRR
jgi:hypothetical protein